MTPGPVEDVQRELRRLLDRFVALGPGRLERPGPDASPAPADVVRAALQDVADAGAELEGWPPRSVPVLGVHALGDQLAVLVGDVVRAAERSPRGTEAASALHQRLVVLRRTV